ncbi:MAG: Verru_Chthon cassette protein A, partial [Verrucomicrobiota bacterium]
MTSIVMLVSTRDAHRASSIYGDGIAVSGLSQQAVNFAISQVRTATGDQTRVWASQPGAIRTYNADGDFDAGYKLYSDDRMVVSGEELEFATLDFLESSSQWSDQPARWVDLNEPVLRDSKAYFPIVDPAALTAQAVEGFRFDTTEIAPSPLQQPISDSGSEALPMPVKWLYQLRDGTTGVLNEANEFVAYVPDGQGGFTEGTGLTTDKNPIAARIAFWTDDETAKVNLNTASEPTFWDTPRAAGPKPEGEGANRKEKDDRAYGWSQPTKREYSRFPGHPAQTALSSVLFPGETLQPWQKRILIDATPKTAWGGSKAAVVPFRQSKAAPRGRSHLYPSVDEYLFQADRSINALGAIGDQKSAASEILARSRFFLTTHSRAPELNVFDEPRISIWPTHSELETEAGKHRTALDELIRFCSSIGNPDSAEKPDQAERFLYSFQRQNSDSPTEDWTEIQRNQEIFAYLQDLTSRPLPGYGSSLEDQFGEDRDQILAQVFDYIRCTNLYDDQLRPNRYSERQWEEDQQSAQFTDGRRGGVNSRHSFPGHGQVVPLEIEDHDARGLGRFYTLSEAGILFICNGDAGGPHPEDPERPQFPKGRLQSNQPGSASGQNRALPRMLDWRAEAQERCIQGTLLFELFSPSLGWTQLVDDLSIKVEILEEFRVDG